MATDHPCLLVNRQTVDHVRNKAGDTAKNRFGFDTQSAWRDIKRQADRFLAAETYSYTVEIPLPGNRRAGTWSYTLSDQTPPQHDDSPNYPPWTAMFQERPDSITTRLMHLSFAYLVTEDNRYAQRAIKIARHLANWDQWTDPSYGAGRLTACLDTGHCTYAVAMCYDWCFPELSERDRSLIRDALIQKGIQACLNGVDRYPADTNGYAVITSGALMGAIAVLPENPEAEQWIQTAIEKIRFSLDQGGEDGGAFEGPMYGTYLLDSFAKALDALEAAEIKHDLFDHPYLTTMDRYCVGLLAPDTKRIPCFGDGGPTAGFPHLMSIIAHRGSTAAAWYLQQIDAIGIRDIYGFLRFNADKLNPVQPDWNPSSVFADVGYASLRDGYNPEAPSLFFKAGPLENNIGHNHYDHNSFVISHGGEWIVCDRGYHSRYDPHERKFSLGTLGHNSVVLDMTQEYLDNPTVPLPGHEQVSRTGAQISEFFAGETFDLVTGNAAGTYNPKGKTILSTFDRTILYLKPHAFLIHDQIESPKPHAFTTLFHADGLSDITVKENAFVIRRTVSEVRGQTSASCPVTLEAGPYPRAERYGPFVRITSEATEQLRMLTVLAPRDNSDPRFVRNGGFEKGMSGWRPRANQDLPNHTIVNDNPAEGDACAQIERSGYYYSAKFRVPPGRTIAALARIRTTELPEGEGATMTLYFWKNNKAFANKRVGPFAHTQWAEHTFSEVVPPGTEEVCLALEFFAPGTGWFDDVRLEADVDPGQAPLPTKMETAHDGADIRVGDDQFLVTFGGEGTAEKAANGLTTDARIAVAKLDVQGNPVAVFIHQGRHVHLAGKPILQTDAKVTGELRLQDDTVTGWFVASAKPHAAPVPMLSLRTPLHAKTARINGRRAKVTYREGQSVLTLEDQ